MDYRLMRKAGFRMLLFGVESASQETLDRLNKGLTVESIIKECKVAKEEGLEPHITIMVGYPWETKTEALETLAFTGELFKKGLVDSLQATIMVPYPGTPLFHTAQQNGWLLTEDWERYDMRSTVWKSPISGMEVQKQAQDLYKLALSPKFLFRKTMSIRSFDDLKYFMRIGVKFAGHLFDFHAGRKGDVKII